MAYTRASRCWPAPVRTLCFLVVLGTLPSFLLSFCPSVSLPSRRFLLKNSLSRAAVKSESDKLPISSHKSHQDVAELAPCTKKNSRRAFCGALVSGLLVSSTLTRPANAGLDPSDLKSFAIEGDQTGGQTRLRQIELEKVRPSDALDIPYTKLPSGVSYRDFRDGKGDAVVQAGSKVGIELTARCKAFGTASEPGGLKYFSTAADTEFNELAFTIAAGQMIPELEEGMMGMKRGAVRRIEVPSPAVYAAKRLNQLPLPTSKDGKRRYENMFKTDATLIFEVLVTRIK